MGGYFYGPIKNISSLIKARLRGDIIPKYKFNRDELEQIQSYPWLTRRERRVFELFYRDGIHIEDIAAELDVTRRTVDRDLQKIRNTVAQPGKKQNEPEAHNRLWG